MASAERTATTVVQLNANRVAPCRVFICYRRRDSGAEAKSIYEGLVERYGRTAVFMDVDTLPPDADFPPELKNAIRQSHAVLVLIGASWLKAAYDDGRRRLDDPDDKVRWEISTALHSRARTIPVLLQGASMPDPMELPPALRILARRRAFEMRANLRYTDIQKLCQKIEEVRDSDWRRRLGRLWPRARRPFAVVAGITLALVLLLGAIAHLSGPATNGTVPTVEAPANDGSLIAQRGSVETVASAQLSNPPVVISGGADAYVRIWDPAQQREIASLRTDPAEPVYAIATAQLGSSTDVVTGSGDGLVRIWDLATRSPIGTPLTGHIGPVRAVTTAQVGDGTDIITGGDDHTVRVWDLRGRRPIGEPLIGHTGPVDAVATVGQGRAAVIITGGQDATVRIWDLATQAPIGKPLTGHTGPVRAVTTAQLRDRTVVVSGGDDGSVRIWDLSSLQPKGVLPACGGTKVTALTTVSDTADDPKVVAGCDNRTAEVWDLASRTMIGRPLTSPSAPVTAVTTVPVDGRVRVVTGSADGTVGFSDLPT